MNILSALARYVRRHHWGLIATFIALGGTAYAAAEIQRNAVKSKHIANGTVKSVDLKKNAVRSPQVKNGSLRAADFAADELPQPDGPDDVLEKLLEVDGSGSGLDADRVDGVDASQLARGASGSVALSDRTSGDPFNTNQTIFNVDGVHMAGFCTEDWNGTGEDTAIVYIFPPVGASLSVGDSNGGTANVTAGNGQGKPVASVSVTGGQNVVEGGWFTMYLPAQDRFASGHASAEINDANSGETCAFGASAQISGAP